MELGLIQKGWMLHSVGLTKNSGGAFVTIVMLKGHSVVMNYIRTVIA